MWDTREMSHRDHLRDLLQHDTFISQFVMQIWGTRIVVTPEIIFEILHVLWVLHTDYPACPHLRTMSKDKLLSLFCETPSSWGERQNTSCSSFAKGPRFLNMVMTFVLHPLSHYNFITEPRACLFLSLIEDHSINFPSHFILSLIDVYRDTMTSDKLPFDYHTDHFSFFCLYPWCSSLYRHGCH